MRSPEQNTGPNVFYLGADRAVLEPLAAPVDDSYIWSTPDPHRLEVRDMQGDAVTGARTTYNTAHPRPWGWRVTTYLWTKGVGAGALLIAALALILGVDLGVLGTLVAPAVALAGAATTAVLLVWDLKRPERFLYILFKPNPSAWLVWGSLALIFFSAVAALWLLVGVLAELGTLNPGTADTLFTVLAWAAVPAAVLTAGYTHFLFGQAEGRDLWQSPLLFWHLLVQAAMVGAGALAVALPFVEVTADARQLVVRTLVVSTVAHVVVLAVEYGRRHGSRNAAAAHAVVHGVTRRCSGASRSASRCSPPHSPA